MIARSWHGYTKPEHADAFEAMLKPELLPGISKAKGYKGSYLLRRAAGGGQPPQQARTGLAGDPGSRVRHHSAV